MKKKLKYLLESLLKNESEHILLFAGICFCQMFHLKTLQEKY